MRWRVTEPDMLLTIIAAVIVLGGLIFFHELGHFLAARALGMGVTTFSLGFGPKLIKIKRGKTEYALSLVPLGGYVALVGENDDSELPEGFTQQESFSGRPAWQRLTVAAAGPLANVLLAWLICWTLCLGWGQAVMLPQVGSVVADSPAAAAGLQRGDLILRVNEAETPDWQSMADAIGASNGQPVTLHVLRPVPTASGELQSGLPETGEELRLTLTPKRAMRTTIFGEQENAWLIGISVSGNMRYEDLSFAQAALAGARQTWGMVELTAESFLKLVQRVVPLDQVGGPIMIAQLVGEQAQQGLAGVLGLAALISINLAILNLLPIPILDGGTVLFCLIEMIFRRPVHEKVQEWGMRVGLALLVCLMLLATYNDIVRIITG